MLALQPSHVCSAEVEQVALITSLDCALCWEWCVTAGAVRAGTARPRCRRIGVPPRRLLAALGCRRWSGKPRACALRGAPGQPIAPTAHQLQHLYLLRTRALARHHAILVTLSTMWSDRRLFMLCWRPDVFETSRGYQIGLGRHLQSYHTQTHAAANDVHKTHLSLTVWIMKCTDPKRYRALCVGATVDTLHVHRRGPVLQACRPVQMAITRHACKHCFSGLRS